MERRTLSCSVRPENEELDDQGSYKEVGQFKEDVPSSNCSETALAASKNRESSSTEHSRQHLDAHLSKMLERRDCQDRKLAWAISEVSSYVTRCSVHGWFVSLHPFFGETPFLCRSGQEELSIKVLCSDPPTPEEGLLPRLAN